MANSVQESFAQFWSRETLATLFGLTPTLGAVNRQYSQDVAEQGDTVKVFRPATMEIDRNGDDPDYTPEDVSLDKVEVKLNMLFKKSILLRDKEMSLSALELRNVFMLPIAQAFAEGVERALIGHCHDFLNDGTPRLRAGKLGGMTKDNSSDYILEAQEILNTNLAPQGPKTAIVHETALTKLRLNSLFTSAEQRGSAMPLETGEIGRVWNTDIRLSQYTPYAYLANADVQTAGATGSAYSAGEDGQLTVTDPGADWQVGEFAVIEGNDQPTWITATSAATDITLNEALKYAVESGADITHYIAATNEATERASGYDGPMTFTHTSGKHLQKGQMIAFGTTPSTRHTYTIIKAIQASATTTTVLLSRPLDATVASGADAFPGPAGGAFNLILDPNAITFVSRPLDAAVGPGAVSVVQNYRGVAMRVTVGYRIEKGAWQVNTDLLCGIKTLNDKLAVVLLS